MNFKLTIRPAIPAAVRHVIEDALEIKGYSVHGGGTRTDLSECDITFSDKTKDEG